MDRTAKIVLAVSFLLLMAWYPLVNKLYPPKPIPLTNTLSNASISNAIPSGTNRVGTNQVALNALPSELRPPAEEQLLTIENENARYHFSSHGGGLKLVELKKYQANVGCDAEKIGTTNLASLNTKAPLAALTLLGVGNGNYTLTRTGDLVRAEVALSNNVRLIKEYQLSTNYMVKTTMRWENHSSEAVTLPLREVIVGTATPAGSHDESLLLGLEWFNGEKAERIKETWFANKTFGCLPGQPRTEYIGGQSNVVWGTAHNQFFAMVAVPATPANQVIGRRIDLPAPTKTELANDPQTFAKPFGYQVSLQFVPVTIPAGSGYVEQIDLFAGPKEYKTLTRLPREMDRVMGFDGFFGSFAKGLLLSMNGLHGMGLSYAMAIITITVIIKLLFWPLTNASTKSMKRMAALQPQMKALQDKYKDDPAKMNRKLMEFMKEHKVSPVGGCIPILLQIPVFFGFYTMLQSAIELRGAEFLWACDLSKPDTIFFIPGLNLPINPLPILMAGTMFWQSSLTPPSPGMDPMQQKMMKYLPLMFVFFFYNASAGLALYWTVQNLISILQMKVTKAQDPTLKPGAAPAAPVKR
ncbi:MAG: membrane protein insertase YidC [Verrucomicrobiota bacterium]|nr:membrane protein insertase YidC [Verrucomicrobiota bacterium]